LGLSTRLVQQAVEIARATGFSKLAVSSAIGTRDYYRKLGSELGELHMGKGISLL